jgi:hypothetical protein
MMLILMPFEVGQKYSSIGALARRAAVLAAFAAGAFFLALMALGTLSPRMMKDPRPPSFIRACGGGQTTPKGKVFGAAGRPRLAVKGEAAAYAFTTHRASEKDVMDAA